MLEKLYRRYRMNFSSPWLTGYCVLCGIAVFLRCVFYFLCTDIASCGAGEIIFSLALPLILLCGIIVLVRIIRLNAPGIMAILGASMCLLLLINGFDTGNFLRLLFSVVGYAAGGALLFLTIAGFVPTRQFSVILFGLLVLLRLLLFRPAGMVPFILEGSDICMLISLAILPATMCTVK